MTVKTAICYSLSLDTQEPMAYVRLTAPLQFEGITLIKGIEQGQTVDAPIKNADVVIIQREFPQNFNDYQKVVLTARKYGKPIVFEIDDLLFFLPKTHPDTRDGYYAPSLLPMFQALIEADCVTVSSQPLNNALSSFNPDTTTLLNFFDDNLWQFSPPIYKDSSHEVLTIGYMGTNSHRPDLDDVTPVLMDLATRYLGRLRFRFWGVQPPAQLLTLPQVEWIDEQFPSYPKFAEFFQTQSADIFIAPLADNFFNRCKSSLKFFEYSALGAAGIFSDLEPYKISITHRGNGLLASSHDDWREGLVELIENNDYRFQLAVNAQESIHKNWLLSQNAYRWRNVLETVCENKQTRLPNMALVDLVNSMNSQLYEKFEVVRGQERMIQKLTSQLRHMEYEKEQLEKEILNYALSKSWQFTRPFRMIKRKLERS